MQSDLSKIREEKFITKTDIAVVLLAVLLAMSLLLFSFATKEESDSYQISVENQIYKTGKLSEDEEIKIKTSNGEVVVCVENGKIYMQESTCKDQICIRQGEISASGEKIICLPNKIVVEILGKKEIDGVS